MKWRSFIRALLLLALIFGMAPGLGAADLGDGMYTRIETGKGDIVLRLFYIRVPITVANFVGLAEGTKPWRAPDGKSRTTKLYDGLTFHRVIRNFMVQGGDPEGTGQGGPGYSFVDEFHPDLKHDKPGTLSMANSGANTNGSQFFITHVPTPWLNNRHTVFGEVVEGQDVVNAIANGDTIRHVTILRIGAEAKAFDLEKTAQAKLRLLARQFGQKEKILPEPGSPVDPARVPQPGQAAVDKVGLEYFIVHYLGAQVQMAPLIYSESEAKAIAKRFAALARAKNADFGALAKIHSDFDRHSIWTIDADNPKVPPFLRDVFTLKVGQVSDPIHSPVGWLVVRRVGIDTVAVSHILVSWRGAANAKTGRSKKEARAIMERIVADLKAGGAFAALVEKFSDDPTTKEKDGRIGELARGQAEPAFERAAFALKPGAISKIVETSFGFHVIRREP